MRSGKLILAGLLLLACIVYWFGLKHLRSKSHPASAPNAALHRLPGMDYALLPASETTAYSIRFAAGNKVEVQSWEPTVGDIQGLENDLPQIASLSENGPGASRHIDDPRRYLRQYLAVVQDGQKKIFINALCSVQQGDPEWRKHLVIVVDGGPCYWQAFYDPTTQKFSDLTINGRG